MPGRFGLLTVAIVGVLVTSAAIAGFGPRGHGHIDVTHGSIGSGTKLDKLQKGLNIVTAALDNHIKTSAALEAAKLDLLTKNGTKIIAPTEATTLSTARVDHQTTAQEMRGTQAEKLFEEIRGTPKLVEGVHAQVKRNN